MNSPDRAVETRSGEVAQHQLAGAPGFSLRGYQEGDEGRILRLFGEVFEAERSAAHWRWKFGDNPYHPPIASLVHDAAGELVAHMAVIPVRLNLMGRPVLVAQLADLMVRADARMHGLFLATARHCFEQSRQAGAEAVYAFPNWNSYPGFIEKLALRRVTFLDSYFLRLSYRDAFRRVLRHAALARMADALPRGVLRARTAARSSLLRRNLPPGTELQRDRTVPSVYEPLWDSIRRYEVLSIWKDAAYLGWRYDAHPDKRYEYFTLVSEGRALAMLVVKLEDGSAQICDLIVRERNRVWGRYLVARTTLALLRDGVEWVAFSGSDPGLFREVFVDYEAHRSLEGGGLCARLLDARPEMTELFYWPHQWTVTLGDNDAF